MVPVKCSMHAEPDPCSWVHKRLPVSRALCMIKHATCNREPVKCASLYPQTGLQASSDELLFIDLLNQMGSTGILHYIQIGLGLKQDH